MKVLPRHQERIHVSWLVTWLMVGVLTGVALAAWVSSPLSTGQAVLMAAGIAVLVCIRPKYGAVCGAMAIGLLLGWSRGSIAQDELAKYEPFIGRDVRMSGIVSEDPAFAGSQQQIRLRNVQVGDTSLPGIVWVSLGAELQLKRSDHVTVEAKLSEGFGNIPAAMWRARIVESDRPLHGDVAREVRDAFSDDGARQAIDAPEVDLGMGFLTGQRSALPPELDEQLRLLGLTHVVVASGYNLTILVRFSRGLFARRSKYLAFAISMLLIVAFVLVTGLSPSMTRAAFVAGLSLLAWYVGRSVHPLSLLLLAAGVTAYLQPSYVWGDLGWYLSFLSFAGVMLLAPLIKSYFFGEKKEENGLVRILIETTSAQLATLPLIAYVFGQYSPLALPANLLVLPFVPLAMLLTFVGGLLSLLILPWAFVFGLPATAVLSYMTWVMDFLAGLPGASMELTVSLGICAAAYAALLAAGLYMWRRTGHSFTKGNIVV